MSKYYLWSAQRNSRMKYDAVITGSGTSAFNDGNNNFSMGAYDGYTHNISPDGEKMFRYHRFGGDTSNSTGSFFTIHQSQSSIPGGFHFGNGTGSNSVVFSSLFSNNWENSNSDSGLRAEWLNNNEIAILAPFIGWKGLNSNHTLTGADFPSSIADSGAGGLFFILSGSGATWNVNFWATGSRSNTYNSVPAGEPLDFEESGMMAINHRYTDTETDLIFIGPRGPGAENAGNIFKKTSGSWGLHAKFAISAQVGDTNHNRDNAQAVRSAAFIGENNDELVISWHDNGNSAYAFTSIFTPSTGSEDENRYKCVARSEVASANNTRMHLAYDPYENRLLSSYSNIMYVLPSSSNWYQGITGSLTTLNSMSDREIFLGQNGQFGPPTTSGEFDNNLIRYKFADGYTGLVFGHSLGYGFMGIIESGSYGWLGAPMNSTSRNTPAEAYMKVSGSSRTDWQGGADLYLTADDSRNRHMPRIAALQTYYGDTWGWNTTKGGSGDKLFTLEGTSYASNQQGYSTGRVIFMDFNAYDGVTPEEWSPISSDTTGSTTYQLSSSATSGIDWIHHELQNEGSASINTSYVGKSGKFSPDGLTMAIPNIHANTGDQSDGNDYISGIDFWTSGSGGWSYLTSSKAHIGASSGLYDLQWLSNDKIVAMTSTNQTAGAPLYWTSSSATGWATESVYLYNTTDVGNPSSTYRNNVQSNTTLLFNEDATAGVIYGEGDYYVTLVSSSAGSNGWIGVLDNKGWADSFVWAGKAADGRYRLISRRGNTGAFAMGLIDPTTGVDTGGGLSAGNELSEYANGADDDAGKFMYWHSGSNSLITTDENGLIVEFKITPFTEHLALSTNSSYDSGSYYTHWLGYWDGRPDDDSTVLSSTPSYLQVGHNPTTAFPISSSEGIGQFNEGTTYANDNPITRAKVIRDPNTYDRFFVGASDSSGAPFKLKVFERGSEGWKMKTVHEIDSSAYNDSTLGRANFNMRFDLSSLGELVVPATGSDTGFQIADVGTYSAPAVQASSVAQAAEGSITFSGLPAQYSLIELDDGQGTAFSNVKFHTAQYSGDGRPALSGSTASDNVQDGDASGIVNLYQRYSTNKAFMYISFNHDSQTNATFKDFATGGTTPLIYEFTDGDGNVVNVTLVNESSGFSANVSGASYSRKDSAGNYSINTNNSGVDGDNIAEELKDILTAARSAGELNINTPRRDSTYYLFFGTDDAGDTPMSFRVKRASGTWTQTSKAAAHISKDDASAAGHRIANIYTPDEVVYSIRNAATGGSGDLTTAQFASYFADMVNGLSNFQISASVSDSTVSLTNDNTGPSGNITITTTDSTNVAVTGMSGGAAGSALAETASVLITAVSGAVLQAGGSSSSPEATLVIASGSLSADTTIELSLATDADPATNGLNEGAINATAYSKVVRVTPHGTQFSSAAQITFNLSGTVEGTCPSNLQIWKRGNPDSPWYRLPSNLWTCESGVITINTTSFSDYQAIGGETMARTKLNNIQLARLEQANKILPDAINITGSLSSLVTTIADSDVFILQKADTETSQHVSASTLQSYFSTLSVENSAEDVDMYLTFVSGAGSQTITIDGSSASGSALRYNPFHDLLSGKNAHLGGYLHIDGALSGSSTLSIAGASELEGTLNVEGAVDFDSTLIVGGTATMAAISGSSTLSIAGASELEGTLNVEGAVDLDSTLDVGGAISGSSTLDIGGAADFGSTVNVVGAISGSSTLDVAGAVELNSTLRVVGASDLDGSLDVAGAISGSSTLEIGGAVEFDSTMRVAGNSDLDGTLDVAGAVNLADNLTVEGNLTVNGTTTQIDTQNLLVEDPIIVLADGNGEATVDQGLVFTRGGVTNHMFLWDESEDHFALVSTSEDGTTSGSVSITDYSAFKVGDITGSDATFSGDINVDGNIAGGTFSGDGSGLSGVGASVDTTSGASATLQIPFVSGSSAAATFFVDTGAITFNPSTNALSVDGPVSGSGTLDIGGAADFASTVTILGAISGSSTLAIGGAAEFDSTMRVAGNSDLDGTLDVAGAISGSSTLDIGGAADFASTVTVLGAISGSSTLAIGGAAEFDSTMRVAGNADLDGTLDVAGAISGSSTLDVAGAVELNSTLRVVGAADLEGDLDVAGAISGSSTLSIAGNSELEGTLNVEGAVDLDSTLNVDGAVTFGSVADLTIDVGDETHYMVVTDSDDNIIKRATLASFVSASATALGAGDGIQVSSGQLSIQFRELIATQYSTGSVLSDDYITASFPSSEEPLSGSLQVYLNGMLLVGSGSVNVAASDPIFDYYFTGSEGARRVEFLTAVDPDDVIQIKYIRK